MGKHARPSRRWIPRRWASPYISVLQGLGAKIATYPFVFLCSAATAAIIIRTGSSRYATYALVLSLTTLLPAGDLGVGASLTTAASVRSKSVEHRTRFQATLYTATRTLLCSFALLLSIVVILWTTGLLDQLILGKGSDSTKSLAVVISLLLYAASFPMSLGQRLLVADELTHRWTRIQAAQSVITLAIVIGLARFGAHDMFLLAPTSAILATNVYATKLGLRRAEMSLRTLAVRVVDRRNYPGEPIARSAIPMAVILLALPAGLNSDRIILAHSPLSGQLANYSLVYQLYTPILVLVSTAGMALWPIYARRRDGGALASPIPMAALFGCLAMLVALFVVAVGPAVNHLVSGGRLHPPLVLYLAFSILVTMQAIQAPIGMFCTDEAGLRFQAIVVVIGLVVNLIATVMMVGRGYLYGPAIGSAIAIFGCQVIPGFFYVHRRNSSRITESTGFVSVLVPTGSRTNG